MSGPDDALRSAHRLAYGLGLAMCLGTPGLIAILILSGVVPPGKQPPDEAVQQIGYLFTGLVFLSAAWAWWRFERTLRSFKVLPAVMRPAMPGGSFC